VACVNKECKTKVVAHNSLYTFAIRDELCRTGPKRPAQRQHQGKEMVSNLESLIRNFFHSPNCDFLIPVAGIADDDGTDLVVETFLQPECKDARID